MYIGHYIGEAVEVAVKFETREELHKPLGPAEVSWAGLGGLVVGRVGGWVIWALAETAFRHSIVNCVLMNCVHE